MTAAHCFIGKPKANQITVIAGQDDISNKKNERTIAKYIVHKEYDQEAYADIALIKLSKALDLDKNGAIEKVNLAKKLPAKGTKCRVLGKDFIAYLLAVPNVF